MKGPKATWGNKKGEYPTTPEQPDQSEGQQWRSSRPLRRSWCKASESTKENHNEKWISVEGDASRGLPANQKLPGLYRQIKNEITNLIQLQNIKSVNK